MDLKKCLTIFLLTIVMVTMAEDTTKNVEVISSEEQFRELVTSKSIFVMFFAPWCGHCQRLKPSWEQLASDINTDETVPVTITTVDCTQHTKLCSDEGVMGYPTLKLYRVGEEATRHKGGRDVESLKKFLMKSIETEDGDDQDAVAAASHVEGLYDLSNDNFQSHIKSGFHFVKFYAPWCGHCRRLEPTWQELAKLHENDDGVTVARVDCTEHRAICTQHGVRGYPTLMMFKDGSKAEDYEGSRELKTLEAFVRKTAKLDAAEAEEGEKDETEDGDDQDAVAAASHVEGLYDLSNDNFQSHIKSGLHFVKFYAPWCGHCRRLEPTWQELAKLHENDDGVTIARIDCTENKEVCGQFQVRGYPTLLLIKDGEMLEKYQSGRDLNSFKNFLKKHTGDEEEEEDEKAEGGDEATQVDGLYVLSSSNFQSHIKSGLHFIKFYAPWCGHCRRLEPTWQELAKLHENDDGVKISKIDCTENSDECSKFEVRGYPTLLLIKDGKKIEKYKSGRDIETLKNYLKGKMSQPNIQPETDDGMQPGVPQRGLTDLTDAIFDDHIKSGVHFIKFYAPWCGHCRRLEPTWKELGKSYEKDNRIKIARIDCTANSKSCSKHEVRGYPTLLMFKDGQKIDKYQGSRELDRLQEYLKMKMTGVDEVDEMEAILQEEKPAAPAPAAAVDDNGDVKGVLYLHATNFDYNVATDAVFVMFYAPWCGFCKKLKPTWMDLSNEDFSAKTEIPVKIANVDCTRNNDLCGEYKVTGFPTLMLFVEGSPRTKYTGERSKEALFDYVISELKKPVQEVPEPEAQEPEPEVQEPEPEEQEPEPEPEAAQVKDEL